ncbi:hypothetical protein Tco_0455453 [Tanacetum coccineum]
MAHDSVGSWFLKLQQSSKSFTIDGRVTWVDIEGVQLCVWSQNTFARISSKWGNMLYDEDKEESYLHRKRICIKTALEENIFKIVAQGKVYWVRAKEVIGWVLEFTKEEEDDNESDDETIDENISPDTAYPPVGYDVSNLLLKQVIDCCRNCFIKEGTTMKDTITELMVKEVLEKVVTNSDSCLINTKINYDSINELSEKFFMELQYNNFGEMVEEDAMGHIANFLGILDPIKIGIFDTDQLRLNIFPLSLTGDARVWWSNGKSYVVNNYKKEGHGYHELMEWIDLKHYDNGIDRMTKSTLCHAWVYRWGNNESEDDIMSSDEEWEESDHGKATNKNDK